MSSFLTPPNNNDQEFLLITSTTTPAPQIVAAVVADLYETVLLTTWSNERYVNFLNFTTTVITVAPNDSEFIIYNSLKLVESYIKVSTRNQQESENSIFLTAMILAQKFHDDFYIQQLDLDLSLFTDMTSLQLKQFQFKFLEKINYKLSMSSMIEYDLWVLECNSGCYYSKFNTTPLVFLSPTPPPPTLQEDDYYHNMDDVMSDDAQTIVATEDYYSLFDDLLLLPPPSNVLYKLENGGFVDMDSSLFDDFGETMIF